MMAAEFDVNTWSNGVLALGVVVGSIAAVVRFFSRTVTRAIKDQLDVKLDPMAEELVTIRGELSYNGGQSTKDAVRRIDKRLTRMEGAFIEHDRLAHEVDEGTTD